ncbi:hypothetical protein Bca52824_079842 [Brassica carinata]|uniref:Uncharacterized protein n=1 Tax=Brassica carinata TaxID=52824 RepID=A0A8X7Q0D7_BRACI|nr:hypothetical protein Bca52824_079842 [Brassica carinata]
MPATTPSKQRGGMIRIGSIRPEYEFDDEEAGVFVQWILVFSWIFKALVEVLWLRHQLLRNHYLRQGEEVAV